MIYNIITPPPPPPSPPEEVTTSSPPTEEVAKAMEYIKNGATFVCSGATELSNDVIYRTEERISVSRYLAGEHCAEFSSIMKQGRNLPGPAWFCKDLGTLDKHHGNVKFFISEVVRRLIGYKSNNAQLATMSRGRYQAKSNLKQSFWYLSHRFALLSNFV